MSSVCVLKLKVQFCTQQKRFEECAQFMWEGPRRPCSFASPDPGSSRYKMRAGLIGYNPRTDLVFGGVRIGMGCMNLVIAISRWQVPVTLIARHSTNVNHYCTAMYNILAIAVFLSLLIPFNNRISHTVFTITPILLDLLPVLYIGPLFQESSLYLPNSIKHFSSVPAFKCSIYCSCITLGVLLLPRVFEHEY